MVGPLNEPVGLDDAKGSDWTPRKGYTRAAVHGAIATVVLIALLAPVAWYAPPMLLRLTVRSAVAFFVAWILFGVVHKAAGMVSPGCSAMVVAFTLVVLFSHHVIFAIRGDWLDHGEVMGMAWLHPANLLFVNFVPLIAVAGCAYFCRHGDADASALAEILSRGIFSPRS